MKSKAAAAKDSTGKTSTKESGGGADEKVDQPSTKFPKLQLVYFPVRAKAEMIRMALAYGRVPFEDLSIQQYFGAGWRDGAKGKAPFGQVPLLKVDGKELAQSGSILRYVSELAGLTPTDPFERARCDAIFEASQELVTGNTNINPIVNVYCDEKFAQTKETYMKAFPGKLANLAKQLGAGPFFFGKEPLYCDLACYHVFNNTLLLETTSLDAHENIKSFMKAVEALPGVSEYLQKRPDCVDVGTKPMLRAKT